MNKSKNRKKVFVVSAILLAVVLVITVLCLIFVDNKTVVYEDFLLNASDHTDENKESAGQVKIAHLSDLHFPRIAIDTDALIDRLTDEKIDLVAITGDLVDRSADIPSCGVYEFIKKLVQVAPVYYVNGNHETSNKQADQLYAFLTGNGAMRA